MDGGQVNTPSDANKRTTAKVADRLYDTFGERVVAVVLVSETGNHAFAKWDGTPENNSSALIKASLHIAQEPK